VSLDPFAVAVGIGFLGAVLGGPAIAYVIDRLPEARRRHALWIVIGAGLVLALCAEFLLRSAIGRVFVYVLASLPGILTFLAFRSLLGSALISLVPMYFVIGHLTRSRPTHMPEIALDRAIGLQPEWMLVYGSLYAFIVPLPMLVIRDPSLLRRAMQAFLTVMLVGYAGFALYPTLAPRPEHFAVDGFAAWCLEIAYSIDPPHGCMPSLHVAYSFVSALACYRVHRGVGAAAAFWAALIGVSTVYTKQHYVMDVIAGALLAGTAYLVFLRSYSFAAAPEADRRAAPRRALVVVVLYAIVVAGFWVAYRLQVSNA
jgi:membrane-associated phospholipid phosphatase